jgi:hypothetical protein
MKQKSDPALNFVPATASTGLSPNASVDPSAETIQSLMDQAAGFSLYATPDLSGKDNGGERGFAASETLSRFNIILEAPTSEGVRASNAYGEMVGKLEIRWLIIPNDFVARPDREPPPCELNPTISQRFVMQETTFIFGDGRDGFRSFGTGRTFPMMVGDKARAVAAAVGNVIEGFGKFKGHEGNFTICGDLQANGFKGHILVRIADPAGELRTQADLPPLQRQAVLDPQSTYLLWAGQKDHGLERANRFSVGPDGQVRGMNIPIRIKRLRLDCAAPGRFEGNDFTVGQAVAREIGFGKGSVAGANPVGTALSPFLFEGVAHYTFHDASGKKVGTITTNFLEGRRFDTKLPGAQEAPAVRFGFFGPIIAGSGCFQGIEGMIYGSTGAVFYPPPGFHLITHFCAARISDPEGKFRGALGVGID